MDRRRIWQLFTMVTGQAPLRTHFFYRSEIELSEIKPPNIDGTIMVSIDIRVWRTGQTERQAYAVLSFSLMDFVFSNCGGSELGRAECTRCVLCILRCGHDDERTVAGPSHVVRDLDTGKLSVWSPKKVRIDFPGSISRGNSTLTPTIQEE